MKLDSEFKIEADLTKPIEEITNKVILPPTKEISSGCTKLLSVVTTFIDNVTYKYIEDSKYKKEKFLNDLSKKYNEIPAQDVVEPDINILGNSLESLKYVLDKDDLVELYTNIMISDMDKRTKEYVHISYVEILKQLSKSDLKILKAIYNMKNIKSIAFGRLQIVDSNDRLLKYELHTAIYFADIKNYNITDYNLFSNSIENLQRLGLIEIRFDKNFAEKYIYDNLIDKLKPSCDYILADIQKTNIDAKLGSEKGIISISNMGYDLMKVCLREN